MDTLTAQALDQLTSSYPGITHISDSHCSSVVRIFKGQNRGRYDVDGPPGPLFDQAYPTVIKGRWRLAPRYAYNRHEASRSLRFRSCLEDGPQYHTFGSGRSGTTEFLQELPNRLLLQSLSDDLPGEIRLGTTFTVKQLRSLCDTVQKAHKEIGERGGRCGVSHIAAVPYHRPDWPSDEEFDPKRFPTVDAIFDHGVLDSASGIRKLSVAVSTTPESDDNFQGIASCRQSPHQVEFVVPTEMFAHFPSAETLTKKLRYVPRTRCSVQVITGAGETDTAQTRAFHRQLVTEFVARDTTRLA